MESALWNGAWVMLRFWRLHGDFGLIVVHARQKFRCPTRSVSPAPQTTFFIQPSESMPVINFASLHLPAPQPLKPLVHIAHVMTDELKPLERKELGISLAYISIVIAQKSSPCWRVAGEEPAVRYAGKGAARHHTIEWGSGEASPSFIEV